MTYTNGIRRYGNASGRGERNRGYGGVSYGFVDLGYPGYTGLGYADDSDAFDPLDPNNAVNTYAPGTAQDAFVNQQPEAPYASGANAAGAAEDYGHPEPLPPVPYAPYPQANAPHAAPPPAPKPAAPLPEEEAVTIVFKDGRPSEQIHNYALTRTALYIISGRVRTIPVDQIDLAATEKANEKAGVDFQLPSAK